MNRIASLAASLGLGLGAGLAGPALAGGLVDPVPEPVIAEPAPVVAPSYDWSGFYAGAQLGYGDLSSNGAGLDGNGAIGGVHAGYRWDFGGFVAAVEGDYDIADIDLGAGLGSLDSVARLKLIGGADLGRSLLYGTAGAAYADADVAGASLSDTGYFIGVGMDYALTERMSLGAELLGHRFDDFDNSGVDLDATTLKAKLSFQF